MTEQVYGKNADSNNRLLYLVTGKELIDSMLMRNGWENFDAPRRYSNRPTVRLLGKSFNAIEMLVKRVRANNNTSIIDDYYKKIDIFAPRLKGYSKDCAF